jgi:hypothetical protein
MKIPTPKVVFYPLKGGLNQMAPAVELDPGLVLDAQNYTPEIAGGYRRKYGFERFDGRASPTAANYWTISATVTGTVSVSATLTGNTSAATGKVLGVFGSVIVLGRVSGTYVTGEALKIAGVTVATSTTAAIVNGAPAPSDDADYRLLSANDIRADILVVPGSGKIRGVAIYNDVVYAFRDNAGATAGDMYHSSAGGWVKVTFGNEIQFTGAVGQVFDGDTITGGTSGATAVVTRAMLRSGTWTVAGAGTLILGAITGTFQNGEALKVATVTKVTSSSLGTAITRAPGGRVESVIANFTGSTATKRLYGADGVNLAFEFDGSHYIPIRTGMTTDTPLHIVEHRNNLYLSFLGSVQYSAVGAPYSWSAVVGAGELATGSAVTGFMPQASSASVGATMAIFTADRTYMLYGTPGTSGFNMAPSIYDTGYQDYTIQLVNNNAWGLTARGIHALMTTQAYGDFFYDAISFNVQTLINAKRGLSCASSINKSANDYRLYFTDGTAVVFGLTGSESSGALPLNYGIPVRVIATGTLSTGAEVTYFGSDNGYIYQDNVGTSFDGAKIEAWIRPVFNNLKSPQARKTFKRATFEVKADGYASVMVSYDQGYANPEVSQATAVSLPIIGAGGYWDQVVWDSFIWDAKTVSNTSISLDGTETNIGFLFYSNRAQDASHVVQGVNLQYIERRLVRGS